MSNMHNIIRAGGEEVIPIFLPVPIMIAGNVNKIVASIAPASVLDYSSMLISSYPAVDSLG
jgi:hypothetical protein